jgi:hypothetical protein
MKSREERKVHNFPTDFTPIYDIDLVARAYSYWEAGGFKPIPPDFFEQVYHANRIQEAHLYWFDDVIQYVKTDAKRPQG